MNERSYLFLVGTTVLLLLFFNIETYLYGLAAIFAIEGITNLRVPIVMAKIMGQSDYTQKGTLRHTPDDMSEATFHPRFNFEAERMVRFVFAIILIFSLIFFEQIWFFPWFMGIMLIIAGISSFCPMIWFLNWLGFK